MILRAPFGVAGRESAARTLRAPKLQVDERRPDSRTGVLMTATGFAFFYSPLMRQVDGALAYTLWSLLVDTWIFFFVPVLLTLLTRG